jgi:hypothetical protein
MVLAVVALAVWCLVPSQLVWLALMPGDGDSSLIQILVPAGMRGSLWLPELATRLREGLVDAS